jgi:hypothetical protein
VELSLKKEGQVLMEILINSTRHWMAEKLHHLDADERNAIQSAGEVFKIAFAVKN